MGARRLGKSGDRVFGAEPAHPDPLEPAFVVRAGFPDAPGCVRGPGRRHEERRPGALGMLDGVKERSGHFRHDGVDLVQDHQQGSRIRAHPRAEQGAHVAGGLGAVRGRADSGELDPGHAITEDAGPFLKPADQPLRIGEGVHSETLGAQSRFARPASDFEEQGRLAVAARAVIQQVLGDRPPGRQSGETMLRPGEFRSAARNHRGNHNRARVGTGFVGSGRMGPEYQRRSEGRRGRNHRPLPHERRSSMTISPSRSGWLTRS